MFDINLIRDDIGKVKSALPAKKVDVDLDKILDIDQKRREIEGADRSGRRLRWEIAPCEREKYARVRWQAA